MKVSCGVCGKYSPTDPENGRLSWWTYGVWYEFHRFVLHWRDLLTYYRHRNEW